MRDLKYLTLLSKSFPSVASASKEIINLEAIQHLPKGTEHFLADIHGEHEAFQHILKNASGNIRRKVGEIFGPELSEEEKRELCTLLYYPEKKLLLRQEERGETAGEGGDEEWLRETILRLVKVCREVCSKYTRSKVRKSLPDNFSYIIEELLHEREGDPDKAAYVRVIVDTIIDTGRARHFIIALCEVIQHLAVDRLHLLGDIWDRGPGAHIIMDTLSRHPSWDIQWGNHDILWMGAAAGNDACICHVLRLSLRYANLSTLEEGYGINLVPLATFAMETYGDDPCGEFAPHLLRGTMDKKTRRLTAQMHKAVTVLGFKVEAALFGRRPEWGMEGRVLLGQVDFSRGVCRMEGREYAMSSCRFPTCDPADPLRLSPAEVELMRKLRRSFLRSERLREHIDLVLRHGCMYAICNGNLLFHASVPLSSDGSLKEVTLAPGERYSGRELLHRLGMAVRSAFETDTPERERVWARDYFLYLWEGPDSPLFDKSKMATFERYFLLDPATHKEEKGWYFKLRGDAGVCERILSAFGVEGESRHIINGHVPVHAADGESPVKAGGRLMVIDGGFSEAYHKETGLAGYTLVYHSRGFQLVSHEPFSSQRDAIEKGTDIKGSTQIVEMAGRRLLVADTDIGAAMREQIADLRDLLYAYRHGIIKEIVAE